MLLLLLLLQPPTPLNTLCFQSSYDQIRRGRGLIHEGPAGLELHMGVCGGLLGVSGRSWEKSLTPPSLLPLVPGVRCRGNEICAGAEVPTHMGICCMVALKFGGSNKESILWEYNLEIKGPVRFSLFISDSNKTF